MTGIGVVVVVGGAGVDVNGLPSIIGGVLGVVVVVTDDVDAAAAVVLPPVVDFDTDVVAVVSIVIFVVWGFCFNLSHTQTHSLTFTSDSKLLPSSFVSSFVFVSLVNTTLYSIQKTIVFAYFYLYFFYIDNVLECCDLLQFRNVIFKI